MWVHHVGGGDREVGRTVTEGCRRLERQQSDRVNRRVGREGGVLVKDRTVVRETTFMSLTQDKMNQPVTGAVFITYDRVIGRKDKSPVSRFSSFFSQT